MTHITLRYDTESNRVLKTFWGHETPDWATEQKAGATVTTTDKTQSDRKKAIESALDAVEAGADYDPDTEHPIAHLTYDPDTDSFGADVSIEQIES